MKRYNEYFISCLKWNKQLPIHWKLLRLKRVLQERKENNFPIKTDNILSLTNVRGVIPYSQKGNIGNKSKENINEYHIAHPNDFVMNSMNVVIGSVGVSKYYGAISPVYYALFPRGDENIRYFEYIFKLPTFEETLKGLGNGILDIRKRIPMLKLNDVLLPIPPREEQDKIVHFLDWKVSAINRLINIKQKQILFLKEFIKSEIERLLHEYPIERTVRLKKLGVFYKGGGFSKDNLSKQQEYPAILYGDIYTQYEYKTEIINHFIDRDVYMSSNKITKGDIVMTGTGETKDEIGKPILYTGLESVAVGGDVIVFHPNEGINAEYLLYQLYGQVALKHRYINGKGDIIVHINSTALGNTIIFMIGETEQKIVTQKINGIITKINKTTDILIKEISMLKEYKATLISDAVTGQIDVRNIFIPEYEQTEENVDNDVEDIEKETDSLMLEKE